MSTLFAPVIIWAVGGIIAWMAGRYHLTLDQQQQVSTDIMGAVGFVASAVAGLWLHWRARVSPPPNGGANVTRSIDKPYGSQPNVGG